MRPSPRVVAAAVMLSLSAGCGGGSSKPAVPVTIPPNAVRVANFAFDPPDVTVATGATVTWVFDQPAAPHNVVSLTGPVSFTSGTPKGTGTFAVAFREPGTYTYICQVHPQMRGTVTVTP